MEAAEWSMSSNTRLSGLQEPIMAPLIPWKEQVGDRYLNLDFPIGSDMMSGLLYSESGWRPQNVSWYDMSSNTRLSGLQEASMGTTYIFPILSSINCALT